jgi:hypothetical protein
MRGWLQNQALSTGNCRTGASAGASRCFGAYVKSTSISHNNHSDVVEAWPKKA